MERVFLFSKAPRLHGVKTRLAPALTAEDALRLHEAMLRDQVAFVSGLSGPGRTCEICFDRPFAPSGALAAAMAGIPRSLQGDGDLGARMHRALARAFDDGATSAAILGADAPTLPRALFEDAMALLRAGADAAVIPALDGGYVSVAVARPLPAMFDRIPWGSPSVLAVTRRRALEQGWRLSETAPWSDVDLAADLPRLLRELAADPSRAPATAELLPRLYERKDRVV